MSAVGALESKDTVLAVSAADDSLQKLCLHEVESTSNQTPESLSTRSPVAELHASPSSHLNTGVNGPVSPPLTRSSARRRARG